MELKGKALYNLLRISWEEDPSMTVQPWQVEDYRALSDGQLFSRLKKLGIALTPESFLMYAENCESPEELVDCLCLEEDPVEKREQAFLLFCELWRHLLPNKQTLVLFCDALDQRIELYDKGEVAEEEHLQEALKDLEDILDDTADAGVSEREAFQHVAHHCAHDLEAFVYDYICDLIASENLLAASELIDSFYAYIAHQKRFDFCRAQIFAENDPAEGNRVLARLLEQLAEEPDLSLLLEIAQYLVTRGDVHLFMQATRQALPLLHTEAELQQLLQLIADYYRCLDRDEEEKAVQQLLHQRKAYPPQRTIEPSDPILQHIASLFEKSDA